MLLLEQVIHKGFFMYWIMLLIDIKSILRFVQ